MSAASHAKLVRAWVSALAMGLAGSLTASEAQERIDQIADDLTHLLPDERMFTAESRRAIASELQSFPTTGKLRAFLTAWWEENRPQAPPEPASEPDDLEATDLPTVDKLMVRRWLSAHALAGNRKAVGDWVAEAWPGNVVGAAVEGQVPALVVDLGLLRRNASPRGYRWLIRHNRSAASIAGKMVWPEPGPRAQPRTDGEQAADAKAAEVRPGETTNGAGEPVPSGQPAKQIAANKAAAIRYADQIAAMTGRTPGAVSPETLNALWAANNRLVRPRSPPEPPTKEAAE